MPLVIEDGSNISGANSYVDLDGIRAFATDRNFDLSTFSDAALEGFAIRAMDYIESYRNRFKGEKTSGNQPLQWPRKVSPDSGNVWAEFADGSIASLVEIDGISIPNDEIPNLLIWAQCQLIIELSRGVDLTPTSFPNRQIQRQTVGPITTVYFENDPSPLLPAFEAFMLPLLSEASGAFIRTVRV